MIDRSWCSAEHAPRSGEAGAVVDGIVDRFDNLHFATFSTAFDSLVTVFEQRRKVVLEFQICLGMCSELIGQPGQCLFVKLVHMCLEVPKLRKDFAGNGRLAGMIADAPDSAVV